MTQFFQAPIPPHPQALFENVSREHGFEPLEVEGSLPLALRGTLYRNGVGLMAQYGSRYEHLFEADGAISGFRFSDTGVSMALRVTQSAGLLEERVAAKHLGSLNAAWPRRIRNAVLGKSKNTANTHIVPCQHRLLALMEGGKPTEIDPETLKTLGETDLEGLIPGTFSAHPHRVAVRKTFYNFGMSYGKETRLQVFALPDSGNNRVLCDLPLKHALMVHDFAVTERHIVFFLCPLKFRIWRILLGLRGFDKNLSWSPELGTEVIVIPIDSPREHIRFSVEPFHTFHFAAAFDDGGELVVDYVRYENGKNLGHIGDGMGLSWLESEAGPSGQLHRARINARKRSFASAPRMLLTCEFPRVAPSQEGSRFSQLWLQSELYVGGILRSQITRVDEQDQATHLLLEPGELSTEPVLVESPTGTVSFVLTVIYDAFKNRSSLLVLNAHSLERLASVHLPEVLPLSFHGSWCPAT